MRSTSLDHQRLMRESTDRVGIALRGDNPIEQLVVSRLLESPAMFRIWESEHSGLMREVANTGFSRTQAALLKKATFRLIHRKALFEYLRDQRVRGSARQRIVLTFHPTRDYTRSVIAEHEVYLRKACSFLCTSHVGANVVHDPGFFDPMRHYQALYAEYFQIFCRTQFSPSSADAEPQRELLPLLKYQLEECRNAIMREQPADKWLRREAELREPTGDTARLPRLDGFRRKPWGHHR
ncbi:MAG: hypothetical protein WA594_05115 [Candidatus Sulfotelmatobacter sp.]